MSRSLRERWQAKTMPEPNSGCWFWMGAINNKGYGRIRVEGKSLYAHRIGYELHHGPILDGLDIDHICSMPLCVNPDHLQAVTPKENQRRTFERGRGVRGKVRATHCLRGHPFDDGNVYRYKTSRICIQCKRERLRQWRAKQRKEQ